MQNRASFSQTNLLLCDVEEFCHVRSFGRGQVLFVLEHLLELEDLSAGERRPDLLLLRIFRVLVRAQVLVEFRRRHGRLRLPLQTDLRCRHDVT